MRFRKTWIVGGLFAILVFVGASIYCMHYADTPTEGIGSCILRR